jgi:thioredoxin 1
MTFYLLISIILSLWYEKLKGDQTKHLSQNRVWAGLKDRLTIEPPIIIFLMFVTPNIIEKGIRTMAKGVMEIDDSNFEAEVIKAEKPVLVDFWAPWCGPCRAIAPLVEELAGTFGDQVKFAKCNVDENPVTPGKYGIRAIPTLIFFKEGDVVEQVTGMVAKSKLEETIKKVL